MCTARLTRLEALRGLVAGAAAAVTGASLGSHETSAKKKGGAKRGRRQRKAVSSATQTTNTRCACTDDLSPKQCPAQSGIEYTCKLCPGIKKGSVQVACDGDTPSCFCQSKECVVGKKTFKKGQPVNVCTPKPCPTADSCDDDNPCTEDKCVNGYCAHKPVICPAPDNKCEEAYCDPEKGCKSRPIDCDDDDACTVDSCDPAKGCKHEPVDCDDDDACTVDSCDPKKGCKHEPVDCDDEIVCTADSCDPDKGCKNIPDDDLCPAKPGCDAVCDPTNPDRDENGCVYTCDTFCGKSTSRGFDIPNEPNSGCVGACRASKTSSISQQACNDSCRDICDEFCPNLSGETEERECTSEAYCDPETFSNCDLA